MKWLELREGQWEKNNFTKTGENWGCLSWHRIGLQVCPEVELWGSSGKEGILISDKGDRIPGRGIIWVNLGKLKKFMVRLYLQFSSVQSLTHVQLFATPWIAARQAFLSITNSRSSLRLTSIESVMPSSHLILCRPLLLLPPIPPSIRVFSIESTLRMRWPKYWSFSFSMSPYNGILLSHKKEST